MSYMGVRVTINSHIVSANLHGTIDTLVVNPVSVRSEIVSFVHANYKPTDFNMVTCANELATKLSEQYCDENILWVEVTIQSPNDIVYNSVAEGKICV